jgi:hypothetical protein
MAVGIGPHAGSTRLTLLSRGPGHRPLSGVEVEVSPNPVARLADAPPSPDALAHLVTDRNGLVTLPANLDEENRVVWLYVRSGQALLARVPFLIGAHTAETLELPDDSLRLETEGEIAHLQARLIDAVARRAVLMALVRTRAKERNWDEVEEQFQQVRGVARIQNFRSDLNAIRVPALKAARERKDRTAELRITKLCDETAELIAHYLDEEKVQELREEINELREMAREEAAAAAPEAGKEDKKAAGKPRADEPAKTETPPPRPRVAF